MSGSYFYPGLIGGLSYHPTIPTVNDFLSSTFTGPAFATVFGPRNCVRHSNYKISMINNSSTNSVLSATIEFSQDGNTWEVANSSSFNGLAPGQVVGVQFSNVSNQQVRVKAQTSGSGGALTGSIAVYYTATN